MQEIYNTLLEIFAAAEANHITPACAADRLAESIIEGTWAARGAR